ncbi:hypothetical protein [Asanoa siamensis]|uniref:hypothetical protein n=1 Tax=Asanoa siamensis TaxID=926357 RepID=UPI001942B566|nr:hypothetical protein [Asanoa siamensis]
MPLDPLDASVRGLPMTKEPATFDEGLRLLRVAVRHTPADDAAYPTRLLNLGAAVMDRWERDHAQADIDEAVALFQEGAAADADVTASCLVNLCHALRMRYRLTGSPSDLDAAVAAGAGCLDLTAHDYDGRPDRIEQAAHALRERYERAHDVADLTAAVNLYRAAAEQSAPPDLTAFSGRPLVHLRNYALSTRELFTVTGDTGSRAAAMMTAFRIAGDPAAAGAVQWAARLTEDSTDPEELDAAAAALRVAAAVSAAADADSLRLDLVAALRRRARLTGRTDDAEAAILAAHDAVDLAQTDGRGLALGALGNTQLTCWTRIGQPAYLDDAVGNLRRADAAAGGTDPVPLTNLSVALLERHELFEDPADLSEAVRAAQRGVAAADPSDDDLIGYSANLAHTLQVRYDWFGRPDDIDEAIVVLRDAVDGADRQTLSVAKAEANLGILHRARFRRSRRPDDLAEAVRYARLALASFLELPGTEDHAGAEMLNLAMALRERARFEGRPDDLDEAADLAVRGVPLLASAEYPRRGLAASILVDRFRRDGRDEDAGTAIGYLDGLAGNPIVSTAARVDAASLSGRLAEDIGDKAAATTAFGVAVDVLARLPFRGTTRRTRERSLAVAAGLAGDAAAAAIDVGDADVAVDRLERGRGVLWAQHLELRGDLSRLAAREPVLAARIETVARQLSDRAMDYLDPVDTSARGPVLELISEALRRASDDIERAVDQSRAALEAAPPDLRAHASSMLGFVLGERYRKRHDRADIDGAVAAAFDAVRDAPVGGAGRYWSQYGETLLDRFYAAQRDGDPGAADLDSAIRALRHAVTAGRSPRDRADDLAVLATAWDRKADGPADPAALSAAVEAWRAAVRAGARDDAERAERTASLALALLRRCDHTGDPADLDEAVGLWDHALAVGGDDDDRAEWHMWRSIALRARWRADGEPADLDAAEAAGRLAIEHAAALDEETRTMVRTALDESARFGRAAR